MKKTHGRKAKLTPELQKKLTMILKSGCTYEAACERVGIGRTTFYRWMEEGDDPLGRKQYRDFRDAVLSAMAEIEIRACESIMNSADPRVLMTFLRCRFPRRYGAQAGSETQINMMRALTPIQGHTEDVAPLPASNVVTVVIKGGKLDDPDDILEGEEG